MFIWNVNKAQKLKTQNCQQRRWWTNQIESNWTRQTYEWVRVWWKERERERETPITNIVFAHNEWIARTQRTRERVWCQQISDNKCTFFLMFRCVLLPLAYVSNNFCWFSWPVNGCQCLLCRAVPFDSYDFVEIITVGECLIKEKLALKKTKKQKKK